MNVCVYCGANVGLRAEYAAAAEALGGLLGEAGHHLIYGGGKVGMMGVVASAALAAGGKVTGVITHYLADLELAHPEVNPMIAVATMHERKSQMAALADVFIALPGGYGTLEELFEALTWLQLGLHAKPVALLNVAGFWTPLLQSLDHFAEEGFISAEHRSMLVVEEEPRALLACLEKHAAVG
jgi:uncharacterized protein (TIGR00730 family)